MKNPCDLPCATCPPIFQRRQPLLGFPHHAFAHIDSEDFSVWRKSTDKFYGVAACSTADVEEALRRVRDEERRDRGGEGEIIMELEDVAVVIVDLWVTLVICGISRPVMDLFLTSAHLLYASTVDSRTIGLGDNIFFRYFLY